MADGRCSFRKMCSSMEYPGVRSWTRMGHCVISVGCRKVVSPYAYSVKSVSHPGGEGGGTRAWSAGQLACTGSTKGGGEGGGGGGEGGDGGEGGEDGGGGADGDGGADGGIIGEGGGWNCVTKEALP